jgi:8-oxo-dGTP diphosphatase
MEKEKRPLIGVGVVVKKDKKILFGLRKKSPEKGCWCFPGGHLEFGETIEECARREVLEETNLKIENLEILKFTQDFYKKENKHYISFVVICDYKSEELKNMEPEKCEKWRWHNLENLPENLMVSTRNFIDSLTKKEIEKINN